MRQHLVLALLTSITLGACGTKRIADLAPGPDPTACSSRGDRAAIARDGYAGWCRQREEF
jgi:hypothetical protein